ncbi:MAG TPA: serine/threonine-protein kinase [Acidimicrobiales bacterium]
MTSLSDVLAGRYRLVELLGQGGMSDVYRAVDERTGMAVAVKVVRSGDPEFAKRLAQEARALEQFEHPGLVRLLHTGVSGAQAYLVMELIKGSTLATMLRQGRLAPTTTARMGAHLAGALAYVHARGIVHRDVKPANVLVTADGDARLGDFGIARLMDASTMTMAGTTLGTAAYMAPEQLEDHQVGPAADIWSLGIVLLECLTGRRVYDGTASEVVAKRLAGPVPLPADLPVPWRLLLSGMLDHEPDRRLDGTEVAVLLASPVYATAWEPSAPTPNGRRTPSLPPSDLTALAPVAAVAASTRVLAPDDTRVLAPGDTRVLAPGDTRAATFTPVPEAKRRGRGWLIGALAALVIAGVGVGVLVAFASSPKGHATTTTTRPGGHATSTTTSTSTTTTTTTTPTTTIPTGVSALTGLTSDVASAENAGGLDGATGDAITAAANRALVDEQAGRTKQASDQLQQAMTLIADGIQNGSISQAEGATLQSDITTLATALGVTSNLSPTAAATTAPTVAPPGPGNGNGNGGGKNG